jgi:hypothetical protein
MNIRAFALSIHVSSILVSADRPANKETLVNAGLPTHQRLKYRPLPQFKGRQLTIPTFAAIGKILLDEMADALSARFLLQSERPSMAMLMAKYGALDLTFTASSPILTTGDTISWEALCTLGLAEREGQLAEEFEWVEKGLSEDTCFLRIFLDCAPPWDAMQLRNEQAELAIARGVSRNLASDAALDYLAENIEERFPVIFIVDDACLANSRSIWVNSHFYL